MRKCGVDMHLKGSARLVVTDERGELPGAFGQGCALLLEGVEREHSLNRAAKSIGMAYSKAWRLVREAEAHLGVPLLIRDGARGSVLTEEGVRAVRSYRTLQLEIEQLIARRLPELFD